MKHSLKASVIIRVLSLSFEWDGYLWFWFRKVKCFNDGETGLGSALVRGYENTKVR